MNVRGTIASVAAILCASVFSGGQAADLNIGVILDGEIKPGVYGRIEIGNNPPPPILFPQPVVIIKERHHHEAPVYLHVPPGHARNWSKHCHRYHACDRPVYFVKSDEYKPGYGKHKREKHGHEKRGHHHEGTSDQVRRTT